jgi:hypothetical protein
MPRTKKTPRHTGCVRLDALIERARAAGMTVEDISQTFERVNFEHWSVTFRLPVDTQGNGLSGYRNRRQVLVGAIRPGSGRPQAFRLHTSVWQVADFEYKDRPATELPMIIAGMIAEADQIGKEQS